MLRLYDTLSRQVKPIEPVTPGVLRIYVCGPTVYRPSHIGNLRTFLLSDLIRRIAELQGMRVILVQNITDVGHLIATDGMGNDGDDKVLAQARLENRHPLEIARKYEELFHQDLNSLNIHPAARYPRASESIDLMQQLITKLVENKHAYIAEDGTVYFDARSFPSYGALSGNRLDDLRPADRFNVVEMGRYKRHPADWALWKPAVDGRRELVWDSPWGKGFPGWHIECSAMSLEFLGNIVDIHTGAIDLRFPHHEDERAQSEAAVGHQVVHNWVHGEHVLFEGHKMAKSTGNVVLLSDVISRGFDPLALRLAFLQSRYRQQLNVGWDAIAAADKTLSRWRARVAEWADSPSKPPNSEYVRRVMTACEDDLDTPTAIVALRELERDSQVAPGAKFETFNFLDRVLGLDLSAAIGKSGPPLPTGAADLLTAREAARIAKDWATADQLRDELSAMGVRVADTPEGQTWQVD